MIISELFKNFTQFGLFKVFITQDTHTYRVLQQISNTSHYSRLYLNVIKSLEALCNFSSAFPGNWYSVFIRPDFDNIIVIHFFIGSKYITANGYCMIGNNLIAWCVA